MFPIAKVDLRKAGKPHQWDRMSKVQRDAWAHEYSRLRIIAKLRRMSDLKIIEVNRTILHRYGMSDEEIDLEFAGRLPRRESKQES